MSVQGEGVLLCPTTLLLYVAWRRYAIVWRCGAAMCGSEGVSAEGHMVHLNGHSARMNWMMGAFVHVSI
jgi:hypothetical protein